MATKLNLAIEDVKIILGRNTTNPLGRLIHINSVGTGGPERIRIHFLGPDEEDNSNLGFRASDGAIVAFMQRRDFADYIIMLKQIGANLLKIELQGDRESVTSFEISTDTDLNETLTETMSKDISEFSES